MTSFDEIPEVPTGLEHDSWIYLTALKDSVEKLVDYFKNLDDNWQWAFLLNDWQHYGEPYYPAQYRKDSNSIVCLSGVVKSGTIGQTIFVLDPTYRPAETMLFPTVSNGAFGVCTVKCTGEVEATVGNNTYFSLDGISFQAE